MFKTLFFFFGEFFSINKSSSGNFLHLINQKVEYFLEYTLQLKRLSFKIIFKRYLFLQNTLILKNRLVKVQIYNSSAIRLFSSRYFFSCYDYSIRTLICSHIHKIAGNSNLNLVYNNTCNK